MYLFQTQLAFLLKAAPINVATEDLCLVHLCFAKLALPGPKLAIKYDSGLIPSFCCISNLCNADQCNLLQ